MSGCVWDSPSSSKDPSQSSEDFTAVCREYRLVSLWCVVKVCPLLLSVAVASKKNLNAAKPLE